MMAEGESTTRKCDFMRETIGIQTDDGRQLCVERIRAASECALGPVLLVHGAGVRRNIFNPPCMDGIGEVLAQAGFDVWNLDWRASIDLAPNQWTLDQAAVYDYPAAVQTILAHTERTEVKALVHCQGSTSFMFALTAGLLPQVDTVISNAVSLHPVVPKHARLKAVIAVPSVGRFLPYLNPQWGINAPPGWPRILNAWVGATHHECQNAVCKWSSFVYGAGFPTLWRHENLSDDTHDWLKGEFAHVPMSFFRQMKRCISAGHIVSTGEFADLPKSVTDQAPRTDARIVLLAGAENACFTRESQERSFDFLDKHAPGRHDFHELAGYGHLDPFIGKHAPRDVFPLIVGELARG